MPENFCSSVIKMMTFFRGVVNVGINTGIDVFPMSLYSDPTHISVQPVAHTTTTVSSSFSLCNRHCGQLLPSDVQGHIT